MSGYKRKERGSSAAYPIVIAGPQVSYKRRRVGGRAFVPGRDRVGGYYGRYAGRQAELKFFDKDYDVATIAIAGELEDSVNEIAQGATESERIGRKCTIRSINWRYNIRLNEEDAAATPAESDVIRLIMYQDRQCNGAIATVLGILETATYQSFRNLAESGRYNILVDKTIAMNRTNGLSDNAGVNSASEVNRSGTFFKKCSIPIEFSGATGAIAEIRSNNVGILLLSKTNQCDFDSKIRIRYSDAN